MLVNNDLVVWVRNKSDWVAKKRVNELNNINLLKRGYLPNDDFMINIGAFYNPFVGFLNNNSNTYNASMGGYLITR